MKRKDSPPPGQPQVKKQKGQDSTSPPSGGGGTSFKLERVVKAPLPEALTPVVTEFHQRGVFLSDGKRYAFVIDALETDVHPSLKNDENINVIKSEDSDVDVAVALAQVEGVKVAPGSSFSFPFSTGPSNRYCLNPGGGPWGLDLETEEKADCAEDDVIDDQLDDVVWNPVQEELVFIPRFGLFNMETRKAILCNHLEEEEEEDEDGEDDGDEGSKPFSLGKAQDEGGPYLWSPSGEYIGCGTGVLQIVELSEKKCRVKKVVSVELDGTIVGIAWATDSTKFALQSESGAIKVYNLADNPVTSKDYTCPLPLPEYTCTIAFSPSKPKLLCGGGACGHGVLDLETGESVATIATSPLLPISLGAWSEDGSRVLINTGRELHVFLEKEE